MTRKSYSTDVSDEEWAFVAPYLALLPEEAGQRRHELREVFRGLHFVAFACIMLHKAVAAMLGP